MAFDRDEDIALEAGTVAPSPDRAWSGFRRHLAFIVGIDRYRNVSPLQTAVNDARGLADVLRDEHGFDVHTLLLDATGAQLRELLQSTLKNGVGPDDRVVFYFAGHGVAVDSADGPAGYLVPADAEKNDTTTYIPMAELQVALDALPCRHLLLVLDCCFSGAFKWSTNERPMTGLIPKRIYAERFARFIADPARQIITSAAYDQKALDVLNGQATGERGVKRVKDGRDHSPFALALFDALAGAADVKVGQRGDGAITATEIYLYIRDHIEPATIQEGANLRQTPSYFPLRGHDKGEFMFRNRNHPFYMDAMPDKSPFKGLASFEPDDAHLFYGRDRVVADLARRAADTGQRLLVVSGPSGTGKSSVIKAGLLPVLKEQGLGVELMRPGEHPMAELAKVEARIAQGTGQVVLIIDQYEELITRCANIDGERQTFDERLKALLGDDDRIERIVITVRSDFEPLLNGCALKADWLAGRCTVPPFTVEELREVIVLPAMQEVMVFEPPALVDQIIDEVVQSPGALPLLSYTLSEMFRAYKRRGDQDQKRELTLADYDAIGGVLGALRTKANELHAEIKTWDGNDLLRKIMLRLVSVEGELAGRKVPEDEFDYADVDPSQARKVTDALADARLIVSDDQGIEPAHDALVRTWDTLREWIHQAGRDNLALGEKLRLAALEYAPSRNPRFLWNDNPNLEKVRKLADDRERCWFNRAEVEFIEASARLKTRKLRVAIGTTATVFAIITALMVWGWVKQSQANSSIAAARTFSDDMLANMMKRLRALDRTQEVRMHLVDKVKGLQTALATGAGAERDDITVFWAHVAAGDAQVDKGRLDTARTHYDNALKSTDGLTDRPEWQRNLSIAHGLLGDLARQDKSRGPNGDVAAAQRHYDTALALDEQLLAQDNSELARRDLFISLQRLADLARRDGNAARSPPDPAFKTRRNLEARGYLERALPIARRLLDEGQTKAKTPNDATEDLRDPAEDRRNLVGVLLELGNVAYTLSADLKDAEGEMALARFGEAHQIATRWPDDVMTHKDMRDPLAIGLGRLSKVHLAQGGMDRAREAARSAVQVHAAGPATNVQAKADEEVRGRQLARYLNLETLGSLELAASRPEEAKVAFRNALEIANAEAAVTPAGSAWQARRFGVSIRLAEVETLFGPRRTAQRAFAQAQAIAPSPADQRIAAACAASPRVPCR